jgi:hypothetical protein
MDPWHLWEVSESCVEWLCVVVLGRLLPAIEAWLGAGSWLEIASLSSAEFLLEP